MDIQIQQQRDRGLRPGILATDGKSIYNMMSFPTKMPGKLNNRLALVLVFCENLGNGNHEWVEASKLTLLEQGNYPL